MNFKQLTLLVNLRPSLMVFLVRVVVLLAAGVRALQVVVPLATEVTMTVCGMELEEDFERGPDDEDALRENRK